MHYANELPKVNGAHFWLAPVLYQDTHPLRHRHTLNLKTCILGKKKLMK